MVAVFPSTSSGSAWVCRPKWATWWALVKANAAHEANNMKKYQPWTLRLGVWIKKIKHNNEPKRPRAILQGPSLHPMPGIHIRNITSRILYLARSLPISVQNTQPAIFCKGKNHQSLSCGVQSYLGGQTKDPWTSELHAIAWSHLWVDFAGQHLKSWYSDSESLNVYKHQKTLISHWNTTKHYAKNKTPNPIL